MAIVSMEINVTCRACGTARVADLEPHPLTGKPADLRIWPCQTCVDASCEEGKQKGVKEGYNASKHDAEPEDGQPRPRRWIGDTK
jgi:hypothetical protein